MKNLSVKSLFPAVSVLSLLILLCGITSTAISQTGIRCNSYLQEIKTDIELPAAASKEVLKLFRIHDSIIVITGNGVFKFKDGKWSGRP